MISPCTNLWRVALGLAAATLFTNCSRFKEYELRDALPATAATEYMNQRPIPAPTVPRTSVPYRPPASTGVRNPTITIPRTVPPGSRTRYSSVSTTQPLLAMTFDDGPHPTHTPRLLEIMAQRNIKATFYVVGKNVQAYPQIVARMVREGHEVANHTWNHPKFTAISDATIRHELQRTAKAIHSACGVYPKTVRPPYGAVTERHRQWIYREFGYPTITWNVDPNDWQKPGPSVVAARLVSGARPGGILLAHDIHSGTISAMPSAFDQLLGKGFRFVTVTQLINADTRVGAAKPSSNPASDSPAETDVVDEEAGDVDDGTVPTLKDAETSDVAAAVSEELSNTADDAATNLVVRDQDEVVYPTPPESLEISDTEPAAASSEADEQSDDEPVVGAGDSQPDAVPVKPIATAKWAL